MKHFTFYLLAVLILLGGCLSTPKNSSGESIPLTGETQQGGGALIPSATIEPTRLPTETPTVTPTATPVPNPMSIEAMRAGEYPGSDIVIVQELAVGSNYRRYYAYYLSQGLKIYALLTVPNGEKPAGGWPAIVFNHGYIPPQVYVTTERYIAYVDRLAKAGYIVFRIDYRGHDRSEGVASGAYSSPGYTVDVLNAVSSLQRFPDVNPDKIGMWGHSMGGYLTLRSMVISREIKAGVIWGGVVGSYADMLYNWRRSGVTASPDSSRGGWRLGWINQYGTPDENLEFWNSVSANAYLKDLSGPIQLQHSVTDEDVPVEFSQTLEKQIQAVGGTVELYTYEGDDHDITRNFTRAMDRTVAFFDTYLR
jgi:uncharacterized protein